MKYWLLITQNQRFDDEMSLIKGHGEEIFIKIFVGDKIFKLRIGTFETIH